MRILHIGNGRAFKIKSIADAFVARGHDVHMLPIPPCDAVWNGVTWHRLADPPLPGKAKVLARLLQARQLVRRLRPDVVHAHNAWGPGWYGALCGLHPFVIHAYGGDLLPEQYGGRPAMGRIFTSWTCRNADQIVVTGHHMIRAAERFGVNRERLTLLPRGVDLDRYRPGLDVTGLRQQLGLRVADPVVLSPRYQVDERIYNLDTVIEAFADLRRRMPRAVCVQLFDPVRESGRATLAQLAANHGVADAYHLVPAVDNASMPLFYNLADAVVSIPSSDGFPVTVLEASACGAALVVSDLPYCGEWFQSGRNGIIVPVRDPKRVADALLELLGDGPRRQRIGMAGRRLVQARADYQRCMDNLEAVYRGLVADRAARKAS
jgi:glycosyltransferase involved in cell wall biosynthesis